MINIGIIGTGVGVRTYIPAFKKNENVTVKGLIGSSLSKTRKFCAVHSIQKIYNDYKELCEDNDIDLVCITSPNMFHFEHLSYAIKCNKNVICEKPLAQNTLEYINSEKIINSSNRLFVVNHQLRFNPYIIAIKRIIDSGILGRIYSIQISQQGSSFSDRNKPWIWSFDSSQGGGVRLAMGSHLIDLLRFWFKGKSISQIRCTMDNVVDSRNDFVSGTKKEVTGSASFHMSGSLETGIDVDIRANAAAFIDSRFDVCIHGTEGEVRFNLDKKLQASVLNNSYTEKHFLIDKVFSDELANEISIFSSSFRYFAPTLIQAVARGQNFIEGAATISDAKWQHNILDFCLESWRTNSEVLLNGNISHQRVKVT